MSALRVLLIGDDTAEAQHICSVLGEANHAVVPVPSFDEASEALLIQKFDAVLITPTFANNGVSAFTAQLRQAEKNQRNAVRTPVLSVLPSSSKNGVPDANGSVDAYLPRGFEPAAFAQTVENLAHAVAQSSEPSQGSAGAPELPVFNVADFEAQVAYDRELMVEIIDLFLAERVQDVAEMTESLAAGDLDQLMRAAHTIKGSLGSLHANLARYRSQELETAAKSGNRQACISLLGALEQDLNELEPRLLSLRDSARAPH
jgi:two-component system sensor histidine kinase/response regulator